MKHTLVAWMEDTPGVLNRVTGMFRRRNFNIDSLTVGHSETEGVSRMTFVVDGDDRMVDQAVKQLEKVVNIYKVENVGDGPAVIREMVLVRVRAEGTTRSEVVQLADIFRGRVVDVAVDSLVVELTGPESRINSFLDLMRHFGIEEMVRTGRIALSRGSHNEHEEADMAWLPGAAGRNGNNGVASR